MAQFVIATIVAFIAYFAAYRWVDKPLTDGEIVRLYYQKKTLLRTVGEQRIFVVAGSNGRFSHSCKVIEAELRHPCENLSIAAGIGLDFLLATYLPALRKGDTVYMPLEFEQYQVDKVAMYSGPDNTILAKREPDLLRSLGWERLLRAWFYADESFLIRALVENALVRKGVQRRFGEASINSNGDQQGHTAQMAEGYRAFIAGQRPVIPLIDARIPRSFAEQVLRDFLMVAREKGVRVVGGLPTTFSDVPIPAPTVERIRGIFVGAGQEFLVLPNSSQYPRACFFDIFYHLNEACQVDHSKILAKSLGALL